MNPTELQSFNQAVALATAGKKTEAYALLIDLYQRVPTDANVYLWLAFTAPDLTTARTAIDYAGKLDPHNASLPGAIAWLVEQERSQAPATAVTATVAAPTPEPAYAVVTTAPSYTTSAGGYKSAFATPAEQPVWAGGQEQPHGSSVLGDGKRATSGVTVMMLITGLVLVAVVVVGLLAVFMIADSPAVGDMPAPPNSRKIDIPSAQQRQLDSALGQYNAKDVKYGLYVSSDSGKSLASFYTDKMKGKGWEQNLNITTNYQSQNLSVQAHTKDQRVSGIIVVGPISQKDISSMGGSLPGLDIKAGDSIVVLVEGNLDDLNNLKSFTGV